MGYDPKNSRQKTKRVQSNAFVCNNNTPPKKKNYPPQTKQHKHSKLTNQNILGNFLIKAHDIAVGPDEINFKATMKNIPQIPMTNLQCIMD